MPVARSTPDELPRLPLVIEPENRDQTTNKDARLVNAYMETVRRGKSTDTHIYKRPGTRALTNVNGGAGDGMGAYNWKGDVYSIFGGNFYKNTTLKGTVDASGGVYQFSSNLNPKLQLGNGLKAYNYDDVSGLVQIERTGDTVTAGSFVIGTSYVIATVGTTNFTLIGASSNTVGVLFVATGVGAGTGTATVAGFPTLFVKGWAYLDQTTYVMDHDANIQGSELENTTNWDPTNTVGANIEPDQGVALNKHLVNVIALKQWSTEVFYDAGNPTGTPLGRIAGAKASVGCQSADSVQNVDGSLLWMATYRNGSASVVMMENLKVTTVSTKSVERILSGIDLSTIYSWQLKFGQHRFYGLTSKFGNITLVLDLTERMWAQWTDTNGNYFPFVASVVDSGGNHLLQHETNGFLYQIDPTILNDSGVATTVDIYTPNYDAGARRRKYISSMEFLGDQTPGSILQVRHSDDDYQTWSIFRKVDLSLRRPFLIDCGTFYTRAYHLRHQSNTVLRLQAVELQMSVGSL